MRVGEIMTRSVEYVSDEDTIREAAGKMRDLDVGPMPVCGDAGRLVGMVTDRDIVIRAVADGLDPNATPVRRVMTEGILFCTEDQDVAQAAAMMKEEQVRRLVVLDGDRKLVGIVSLGDIATETADTAEVGETLGQVSEPSTVRG